MADNDEVSGSPDHDASPTEETRPVLPPDPATQPADATAAPVPIMKPRWRDRVWDFRAMVAVALATLVLGGVIGGTIVAVASNDDDHGQVWMGPGKGPGWHGGPRQFRGGGPRWNEGPQPPNGMMTPYGQPSPAPTPAPPSPSQ